MSQTSKKWTENLKKKYRAKITHQSRNTVWKK